MTPTPPVARRPVENPGAAAAAKLTMAVVGEIPVVVEKELGVLGVGGGGGRQEGERRRNAGSQSAAAQNCVQNEAETEVMVLRNVHEHESVTNLGPKPSPLRHTSR